MKAGLSAILVLVGLLTACAHSPEKLRSLQTEIDTLKSRLAKLEAQQAAKTDTSGTVQAEPAVGWRNPASWKLMRKGLSAGDVRKILGEPSRTLAGAIVFWFYPNDGRVALINDQVNSWTDPP